MSGAVFVGGDEVGAVILDVGYYRTKVGIAGEDTPKGVFPTVVGCREVAASMDTSDDTATGQPTHITEHALGAGRLVVPVAGREIRHPLKDGLVDNWDLYEQVIQHAYSSCVRAPPRENPILVVEPAWNSKACRERLVEILFEKYEVPALYLAKAPMLSSFANGRGTALVVDAGAEFTSVAPVYEGTVLLSAVKRSPVAGNFITRQYAVAMEKRGVEVVPSNMVAKKTAVGEDQPAVWTKRSTYPAVTDSYRRYMADEVLRDLQVSITRISDKKFNVSSQTLGNIPTTHFEFPNGYNCNWGIERYEIGECLFYPRDYDRANLCGIDLVDPMAVDGEEWDVGTKFMFQLPQGQAPKVKPIRSQWTGVQQLVADAIHACDVDVQASLWGNIVVCGATSLHQGYAERLAYELNSLAPPGTRLKVTSTPSSQERMFSSWLGGSIYASLGTFQKLWVSRKEYDEQDKFVVEKRCP